METDGVLDASVSMYSIKRLLGAVLKDAFKVLKDPQTEIAMKRRELHWLRDQREGINCFTATEICDVLDLPYEAVLREARRLLEKAEDTCVG